jgi:GNAT superfamily N-acetyltransferase
MWTPPSSFKESHPGEWIESWALVDLHNGASDTARADLGLEVHEVDGVLVSVCKTHPTILLNRAVGLGLTEIASRQTIQAIAAIYKSASVAKYYLHVSPAADTPEVHRWLEELGLSPVRAWMKFHRDTTAPAHQETSLELRAAAPEDGAAFGRIVTGGFGMDPALGSVLAALIGQPHWQPFMVFDGDAPAGAAALYAREGLGWLDWAATDPAFRGRGGQGALLRHRITRARELGCTRIFTATGEEVPGDPQHSYRNIERVGFAPDYLRKNYSA